MKVFFLIVACSLFLSAAFAQQESDSTKKQTATAKAFRKGLKVISTSRRDTILNESSTDAYKVFENRIIRNIDVQFIGFERSIYDTAKKVNTFVARTANALHSSTKEKTIRNNLFVRKNTPLNPYMLSDNERFLRDLDFILDARFVVSAIEGSDSVDVTVITRDVFSLGAKFAGSANAPQISIYDANVAGQGQRIQATALIDPSRDPTFGFGGSYRKQSLLGSFANVALGYTQINTGQSFGEENEYAYFLGIDRPLVSPYTRLAGGLQVSNNWSVNVFGEPDSTFLDYNYKIFDTWLGYNFGIRRQDRSRFFLAARYLDGAFIETPDQEQYQDDIDYNSIEGVLGELTFYRKNYFKTRYVFGFGRTEDVPFGITTSVTFGYLTELSLSRPYGAIKYYSGRASKKGNFYLFNANVGGYVRNGKAEDVLVNGTASYYTRALNVKKYKLRGSFSVGYAQLFNQTAYDYLTIRKSEVRGIPGSATDSLQGTQRLTAHLEATLYSPRSILGFRFAPFAGLDWATMDCVECDETNPNVFGINAGVRTRNENLIFGTMELRLIYIPDDGRGDSQFKVEFKQNLRVKSSGTFANKPKPVFN